MSALTRRRYPSAMTAGALAFLTRSSRLPMLGTQPGEVWHGLISVLIGVLVIVVVGAICFWAIDKFAADRRLSQLLKLLVVLICLGAILQRVLPLI
jgi:hypothetical protein